MGAAGEAAGTAGTMGAAVGAGGASETAGVLTIAPFNPLWLSVVAGIVLAAWLVWLAFRKRPEQVRERLVVGLCAAATVLFLLEKHWLSLDAEYLATQVGGGFDVLSELPLHLCNVNMLLMPVALLSKQRALLAFCCLSAPLGAFMALATPLAVFSGSSLLLLRNIGYYGTHSLLVVAGLGPLTLGLFRPAFRDLLPTIALLLAAQTSMHLVNTALRLSGASPGANYFFTYGPENSGILELLWGLVPVPFVYELLLLPAALAYGSLATALIRLVQRATSRGEPKR